MSALALKFFNLMFAVAVLAGATCAGAAERDKRKPNVLVIVADDLGNGDLGVQGGRDIPTPNIDSIANGGVRFTNGYVTCPVCSPTRAGLLTGRYQERFGHEFNPGPQAAETFGLPLDQSTIADAFKAAGYKTGLVGKWHQGNRPEYVPQKRGFDEFFGFLGGAHPYSPVAANTTGALRGILRGTEDIHEKDYLTDAFGREAVAFVDRHQKEPFFLYLAFNAVHTPLQATPKYLERFPKLEGDRKTYAAILSALDDAIGGVLAKVREAGLEENTLIFFVSDNGGPEKANASDNGAFNGVKGTVYEGGVRVPFFVQWKGKLPKGTTREQLAATIDIFPTAIAAAGIEAPKDKALDGVNLLPAAQDASAKSRDSIFWRYGPQWAVRDGKWKLAKLPAAAGAEPQLFDLASDPGEKADVASANPEVLASLKAKYEEWNKGNQEPKWKNGAGGGAGVAAAAGAGNGTRRQARLAAQEQKPTEPNQQPAPAATDKAAAPQAK